MSFFSKICCCLNGGKVANEEDKKIEIEIRNQKQVTLITENDEKCFEKMREQHMESQRLNIDLNREIRRLYEVEKENKRFAEELDAKQLEENRKIKQIEDLSALALQCREERDKARQIAEIAEKENSRLKSLINDLELQLSSLLQKESVSKVEKKQLATSKNNPEKSKQSSATVEVLEI